MLRDRIHPRRTALLVVDLSNDFVHPDGKAAQLGGRDVRPAAEAVANAARLARCARAAQVPVIHALHTTLPDGASDSAVWHDARSRATYSAVDICLDGSWGQQPVSEIGMAPEDLVVKKFRYGAFTGTHLELVLRSLGRDTTVVCGVSTNVCVDTTAREAFSREFYVHIPGDACASWDMRLHDASLKTAAQRFAVVIRTEQVIEAWQQSAAGPPFQEASHAR